MRLTVLGSNGTYPLPDRPGSGYLVVADGVALLLDLGPGVFAEMRRRRERPDAVVLSHVHPDHGLDLFPLFSSLRFGDPRHWGIPVFLPVGATERFAAFLGAEPGHPLFDVFAFDVVAPGDMRTIGPFRLEFGAAVHPVPALVVSVEAGGRRLVYSGDTGPGGDLAALAQGCDLLLCEATDQGEPGPDRFPYHLHAGEAGEVAAAAGVGRLLVTHLSPTLDPSVSVAEAGVVFDGPVGHADPGMEVDV